MNIIKCLALTGALAGLAACGTNEPAVDNTDTNMLVEDNMMLPPAEDMNMDMNMANDMNMMNDMNMSNDMNVSNNMTDNSTNTM